MGFEKKNVNLDRVFIDGYDWTEYFDKIATEIASNLMSRSIRSDEEERKKLFLALEEKVLELLDEWNRT